MKPLSDLVQVEHRFARSANVERDVSQEEPLDGYVLTARAADVVERVAATAAACRGGGAWSLTGPYGSGKSSLALLLDAVFGSSRERVTQRAVSLLRESSPGTADLVERACAAYDVRSGFLRGVVTANREPIPHTVLRSLVSAAVREWGSIPSRREFPASDLLKQAIDDASSGDPRRTGPSPASLVAIAKAMAEIAPLLIVIDEFGKNLEAINDSSQSDPYLLQQLAEAAQGTNGLPIFLLTLQHLSFEDYLSNLDNARRQEWSKVQGRFEDVPYIESPAQTRKLVSKAFTVVDETLSRRIAKWAQERARELEPLGLQDIADPALLAECYPLHPVVLAVLPELCSRYGQNERTLFSFLAGTESTSVASFMRRSTVSASEPLPTVSLDQVYDYFVAGGTLTVGGGPSSSRWTEIATRIRDASGLTPPQLRLLKSIAILNLVSTGGSLRASDQLLALCVEKPNSALCELEDGGMITYRAFADEYRVWQGSDVDIRVLVDAALARVQRRPLSEVLGAIDRPLPRVAARHSAEHDHLRIFECRYVGDDECLEPPGPFEPVDGILAYFVGSGSELPRAQAGDATSKPVVVAVPKSLKELERAARDVAALTEALADPIVADDWVARRELGEQAAQARRVLEGVLVSTFADPATCRHYLLGADGHEPLPSGRGSAALSAAADRRFTQSPRVRNEMLNRSKLSSQGAKARRLLLEAMLTREDQEDLGFVGYGPEMAMYRALLKNTGIHYHDSRSGKWKFRKPTDRALAPVWEAIEAQFKRSRERRVNVNDLYATLQSPPYGMKTGALPVLVTAALIVHSDAIAVYEHGTFKPILTPDVSERMVRNPAHFDLKHFSSASGGRSAVLEAVASTLGVTQRAPRQRVGNVLSIVGALVGIAARLEPYTQRTASLDPRAMALRDALLEATEPDELLFHALPVALGYPEIGSDLDEYPAAAELAQSLQASLETLRLFYRRMLQGVVRQLLELCGERSRRAVAGQAAALHGHVLDPNTRAFVLALESEVYDSDEDWAENVATVVTRKAPAEWTDQDRAAFERELSARVLSFHRLLALHAERKATGAGAFDALRITVTRPDGMEEARLLSVDKADEDLVETLVGRMLGELADHMGSATLAFRSALTVMSRRLVALSDGSGGLEFDDGRKASHG